jgi:glycosyltransferase involved in cell wall biosynthesis
VPNYFYMNDFPLTVANGGKEEQLRQVTTFIEPIFHDRIYSIHDTLAPKIKTGDVLHFFGDTPLFYYFIQFLRGNGIEPRTLISPSFYRKESRFYKLLRFIPARIPNWFSEREKLYTIIDQIIVNSEFEKKYLLRIFKINANKVNVIYNSFESTASSSELRTAHKNKFCLCVSHLSERKNIFELLNAAEKFYLNTGVKLVLAGGLRFHSDKNLDKFRTRLNEIKGIEYVGLQNKSQLHLLYRTCQFHILPSFIETPGISNLEAASFKKPIVVGDFPVLHEYFGSNAIYTKFGQSSIYSAMRKAMEVAEVGEVNHNLTRFSQSVIKAKYINLIASLT